MKLQKSSKDPELYYYFTKSGEKLWMYRHKYNDKLGKRREKKKSSFKTEKTALQALLEVKAATLRGDTKLVEYDQLTVGEWMDTWYEANTSIWKLSTLATRDYHIRVYIKPLLGMYKLQDLDKSTYRRVFINKLEKNLKPRTVRAIHTSFKTAINAAVEEEILDRNRFTKIPFAKTDEPEEMLNYYTPAELNKFLSVVKQQENISIYTFFLTLAYTGLRRGEVYGLQWKNIDFKKKTLTVERNRGFHGIGTPKTKNSYRTIKIDDVLVKQLKLYKIRCKEIMLANGINFNDDRFMIIRGNGDPEYFNHATYVLKKLIKRNELSTITLHGFRHTHATILLNSGLNVKVIAERLGNTVEMVYTIYGHVLKELEEQAVDVFAKSLEIGATIGASST